MSCLYILDISLWWVKVAQLCPTLCDPMNPTVHGILQARILEWVAFPISRGSSQPRDRTQVSCIAGRFFTSWATREAQELLEWVAYPFSCVSSWPRNRTHHMQFFFHSIGCLLVLLMIFFAVQKLLCLIMSHSFIFACISFALEDWSKEIMLWFMSKCLAYVLF